jgi:hypothetical protein
MHQFAHHNATRATYFLPHNTWAFFLQFVVSSAGSRTAWLSGNTILSHKRHDFREKRVTEHKMRVLIFSTTFTWNVSHSKKNSTTYCHKRENVYMKSARYSCRILMKLEFSRQIFGENSNIKFHQNPSSGSRVVPRGRTDRRADGQTWQS